MTASLLALLSVYSQLLWFFTKWRLVVAVVLLAILFVWMARVLRYQREAVEELRAMHALLAEKTRDSGE